MESIWLPSSAPGSKISPTQNVVAAMSVCHGYPDPAGGGGTAGAAGGGGVAVPVADAAGTGVAVVAGVGRAAAAGRDGVGLPEPSGGGGAVHAAAHTPTAQAMPPHSTARSTPRSRCIVVNRQ
ncbi:hypothetical protein [Compostimonas suwonensis]|uniref:hypothetical protein n=1 Tax=Compostimonas suwonensis TaxID=1048394 RepID=UPI001FE7ACBA|nr:hypothetical protein [Compostimonas suwonensis]